MKKIVRGNDFTLRIPVRKIVNGEQVAFPLPACTDIAVNVVNAYRRISLAFSIDAAEDNVLLARVEGDAINIGTYALEVKGRLFGNDWRSNEYEQFQIVDNNASGDTAFVPQEGEDSVEMDTALVFLPPSAELGGLIADAENVTSQAKKVIADIERRTDVAVAAAHVATAHATKEGDRAKAQADHPNIVGADGYWYRWNEGTGEYVKTDCYSRGTIDFPTFTVTDDAELYVHITDGSDKRFELSDNGELLINLNNNI